MIEAQATWTTERIALLKNRMDAGLSCGQIAQELGVSRNAVIGKANRLGLSRFKRAIDGRETIGMRRSTRAKTQVTILRALWAKPQLAAFATLAVDGAHACSLLELQQWHCRWPMGDPGSKDFGFCGAKPIDGLPYCPRHARMAYRPRIEACG
jgi:GcrA cell cycle regulator